MDKFDARRAALDLVTAFVNNNSFKAQELPALLSDVYEAISGFGEEKKGAAVTSKNDGVAQAPSAPTVEAVSPKADAAPKAAVSAEESLSDPNHIVSMITGEKMKTLKRHLRFHGLDEQQYKERYNLPQDYPMVAPAYSILRRKVAKQMGLGRVGKAAADKSAPAVKASPKPTAAKTKTKSKATAAPKKAETAAAAALKATPQKGPAKKADAKSAQPSAATAVPAATPVKKASEKVAPSKAGPAKKRAKPSTKAAKPKASTPSKADTKASGATASAGATASPAKVAADAPKAAEAKPAPASSDDAPRQKLKPVFNA